MSNSLSLLLLFFFVLTLIQSGCSDPSRSQKEILYIGTFAEEGLYVLEFDRAERTFSEIQRIPDNASPNFQAIHPNEPYLYSVSRAGEHGIVSAYRIDTRTGMLTPINEQIEESRGQNHISIDPNGRFAYVSNGGDGTLSVYRIREDGGLTESVDVVRHEGSSIHPRQQAAYMHSNIPSPDGRFIYASDLGIDKVMIHEVDEQTGSLTPAQTPHADLDPGSGPRHFRIHPTSDFAYSVDELSSTITAFRRDGTTGALERIQRIDMLPEDFEGESWSADIHISPDGHFLYATNRGHDSLVIYAIDPATGLLEIRGHEATRGGHPRNFAIDAHGKFIFMTNRDDHNVVLFERDPETGLLTYTGVEAEIPYPVCVTQYFIE